MTLQQLLADLDAAGVCTLDTGGRISAAQARRLACSAGIIPLVLGGKSQVLDVGRKRRSHTEAMRIVMGVRDRGCTEEHCEAPPGLCHAHHDTPWSQGGPTNIDTGRLLCPHHHRRIHDPAYQTTPTAQRQDPLPPPRVSRGCTRPWQQLKRGLGTVRLAARPDTCGSRVRVRHTKWPL